jgi:molybdopterin/thiamine biosynthesis adenylyltransferase
MNYQELVRSNWGFIPEEGQEKIRCTQILLAGCGLGSNIALLAARTGFTNFILADGDSVKLGNLNRQAFRAEHIERNKAEMTAELIHEINPEAKIEVFPQFITTIDEMDNLVSKADLIINMVDPSPVIFQLNRFAIKQGKPVLFPLNIGFGGAVFIFTGYSATLEQMIGPETKPDEFFLNLVLKMEPQLPEYLKTHMAIKDRVMKDGSALPQLGIAANISSALIVTAMIRLTLGVPVEVAPQPLSLDSWQIVRGHSI